MNLVDYKGKLWLLIRDWYAHVPELYVVFGKSRQTKAYETKHLCQYSQRQSYHPSA